MSDTPNRIDEAARLAALQSYAVLDTAPEAPYDDLVRLASTICSTPTALITLVDEDRQWFKARVGLEMTQTPRDQAFCAFAIQNDETLVVGDATQDQRFRENPLVLTDPNIRFYAGAPLRTAEGHGLGTLCVIDTAPRTAAPLSDVQIDALEALSRQAVRLLEHRRVASQLAHALAHTKLLSPLVPICSWCRRIRDDAHYWSSLEEYLETQAGVMATHGICPPCLAGMDQES